ncbi:MAG TPA: hypothetical protein VMF31_00155 [Solirubrobacterales bacterium]|nr:hypothetical protein [Solirubrobacterales bacterium]
MRLLLERLGRLLGLSAVVVLFSGGVVTPAFGGETSSATIEFYQDEFDLSEKAATHRASAQGYAFPLSSALPESLGEEFTSFEFVPRAGYFNVKVRSADGVKLAERVFDEQNVPVPMQVEVVGFNERELNLHVKELRARFEDEISRHEALVSVEGGRPLISISSELASSGRAKISGALDDRFGTTREIVERNELVGRAEACSNTYCNDIVAGENLDGYDPVWLTCSTGFVGRDDLGRHVVLTAGHCLLPGPELYRYWRSCYSGKINCGYAGLALRSEFQFNSAGDRGLLRYDEVASNFGIASKYADWNTGNPVVVGSSFVALPPTGIVVCLNAISSDTGQGRQTCGTITSNNYSAPVGATTVNGTLGITGACTDYGMSGGPWVFDFGGIKVATGTHIGSSPGSPAGCGMASAEPIDRAKAAFGITIP